MTGHALQRLKVAALGLLAAVVLHVFTEPMLRGFAQCEARGACPNQGEN